MSSRSTSRDRRYKEEWETTHAEIQATSGRKTWEKEIDKAVRMLPLPQEWDAQPIESLVPLIMGGSNYGEGRTDTKDSLIAATVHFGKFMHTSQWDMQCDDITDQRIKAFRELVFTSVCITLLEYQIDEDQLNRMMRLVFATSSADKNIRRLRNGTHWVHRMIRDLMIRGWGSRSSQVFFYCKISRRRLSNYITYQKRVAVGSGVQTYARMWETSNSTDIFLAQFREYETVCEDRRNLLITAVYLVLGRSVQ
ncbi:MAG: hypothetical protein MMC23_007742 [Stictis urceolatum]|nr:hypothetical protein [Stictis urceolata]